MITWVKEISAKEKPLDTPELIKKRYKWVYKNQKRLASASIDEKWFYLMNRRKKVKKLPLGPNEKEGDDKISIPQMRNRWFLIKSMFLAVVGRSKPEYSFDGNIWIYIVSKE